MPAPGRAPGFSGEINHFVTAACCARQLPGI